MISIFFFAVDDQHLYAVMGVLFLFFLIPLIFPLLLLIGAVKVILSAII
jgi:hypothetical protein